MDKRLFISLAAYGYDRSGRENVTEMPLKIQVHSKCQALDLVFENSFNVDTLVRDLHPYQNWYIKPLTTLTQPTHVLVDRLNDNMQKSRQLAEALLTLWGRVFGTCFTPEKWKKFQDNIGFSLRMVAADVALYPALTKEAIRAGIFERPDNEGVLNPEYLTSLVHPVDDDEPPSSVSFVPRRTGRETYNQYGCLAHPVEQNMESYLSLLRRPEVVDRVTYLPLVKEISGSDVVFSGGKPSRVFGSLIVQENHQGVHWSADFKKHFEIVEEDVDPRRGDLCLAGENDLPVLRKYQKFIQCLMNPATAPVGDSQRGKAGILLWHTTGAGKTCVAKAVIGTFLANITPSRPYTRFCWATDPNIKEDTIISTADICFWRAIVDVNWPQRDNILSQYMAAGGDMGRTKEDRVAFLKGQKGKQTIRCAYLNNFKPDNFPSGKHFGNSDRSVAMVYSNLPGIIFKSFRELRSTEFDPLTGLLLVIDEAHLLFPKGKEHKGLEGSGTLPAHLQKLTPGGMGQTREAFRLVNYFRTTGRGRDRALWALQNVVSATNVSIPAVHRIAAAIAYSNLFHLHSKSPAPIRVVLMTATPGRSNFKEFLHLMNLTLQFPHDPSAIETAEMSIERRPGGESHLRFSFDVGVDGRSARHNISLDDLFSGAVSRVTANNNPRLFPIKLAMSPCVTNYPPQIPITKDWYAGMVPCPLSPYQMALFLQTCPSIRSTSAVTTTFLERLKCQRVALTIAQQRGHWGVTLSEKPINMEVTSLGEAIAKVAFEEKDEGVDMAQRVIKLDVSLADSMVKVSMQATGEQAQQIEEGLGEGEDVQVLERGGRIEDVQVGDMGSLRGYKRIRDIHYEPILEKPRDLGDLTGRFQIPQSQQVGIKVEKRGIGVGGRKDLKLSKFNFRGPSAVGKARGERRDTGGVLRKPVSEKDIERQRRQGERKEVSQSCSFLEVKDLSPYTLTGPKVVDAGESKKEEPLKALSKIQIQGRFDAKHYNPETLVAEHDVFTVPSPEHPRQRKLVKMKGVELLSGKITRLIQMINFLDEQDFTKRGDVFKHAIYTDIDYSGYSVVRAIAGCLLAFPFRSRDGKFYRPQLKCVRPEDFEMGGTPRNPQASVKNDVAYVMKKQANGKWKWEQVKACPLAPSIVILSKDGIKDILGKTTDTFRLNENKRTKAMKEAIISFFNSPANLNGQNARFFIIDKAYHKGLNVKRTPYMHIMDVPEVAADFTQTMGRITRLCGSKGLPYGVDSGCGWQAKIYLYVAAVCDTNSVVCDPNNYFLLFPSIISRLSADDADKRKLSLLETYVERSPAITIDHDLNRLLSDTEIYKRFCGEPSCANQNWILWEAQKRIIYEISGNEEKFEALNDEIQRKVKILREKHPRAGAGRGDVMPESRSHVPAHVSVPPTPHVRVPPTPPHVRAPPQRQASRRVPPSAVGGSRRAQEMVRQSRRHSSSIEPPRRPVAPPHQPKKPVVSDDEEEAWDSSMESDSGSDDDEMPRGLLPPRRTHSRRA